MHWSKTENRQIVIEKIRIHHLGKPIHTEKWKKILSERMKGNKFGFQKGQGYWLGKKRPEVKQWLKLFKKGHKAWNKGKKGLITNTGRTWFKKGQKPSEKQRQIARQNWLGEKNPRWSGGQYTDKHGYKFIHDDKNRWRKEHRIIVEKIIGRELKKWETIHHINEIKTDNRSENLYYFSNDSQHKSYHGLKNKPILKSNLHTIT